MGFIPTIGVLPASVGSVPMSTFLGFLGLTFFWGDSKFFSAPDSLSFSRDFLFQFLKFLKFQEIFLFSRDFFKSLSLRSQFKLQIFQVSRDFSRSLSFKRFFESLSSRDFFLETFLRKKDTFF